MKQIAGDSLGDEFKGYLLKITGGNDKQGTDGQPLLFIMVPMIPCYGGKDWKSWDSGGRWNLGNHAFLKAIAKWKHGLTVLIFRFPHEAGWYVIDRPNQQNHRIRKLIDLPVLLPTRTRLLLADGHSCYRPRRTGERKRKSVRGGMFGPPSHTNRSVRPAKE